MKKINEWGTSAFYVVNIFNLSYILNFIRVPTTHPAVFKRNFRPHVRYSISRQNNSPKILYFFTNVFTQVQLS